MGRKKKKDKEKNGHFRSPFFVSILLNYIFSKT